MNLRQRLSAAYQAFRTGRTYADGYSLGIEHARETDELVDQAIARAAVRYAVDHLDALVAVENFPLGRPRPTGQPILTLVGGAR